MSKDEQSSRGETHEVSVLLLTLSMSEKAVAPVWSFKAIVLRKGQSPAPTLVSQDSQGGASRKINQPGEGSASLLRELLDLQNNRKSPTCKNRTTDARREQMAGQL